MNKWNHLRLRLLKKKTNQIKETLVKVNTTALTNIIKKKEKENKTKRQSNYLKMKLSPTYLEARRVRRRPLQLLKPRRLFHKQAELPGL